MEPSQLPVRKGILVLRHAYTTDHRWIEAQRFGVSGHDREQGLICIAIERVVWVARTTVRSAAGSRWPSVAAVTAACPYVVTHSCMT